MFGCLWFQEHISFPFTIFIVKRRRNNIVPTEVRPGDYFDQIDRKEVLT